MIMWVTREEKRGKGDREERVGDNRNSLDWLDQVMKWLGGSQVKKLLNNQANSNMKQELDDSE